MYLLVHDLVQECRKMWLEDIPLTISVQNSTVDMDSSDEEFTHDRLVDEDIDYISRYLNANSEPENYTL